MCSHRNSTVSAEGLRSPVRVVEAERSHTGRDFSKELRKHCNRSGEQQKRGGGQRGLFLKCENSIVRIQSPSINKRQCHREHRRDKVVRRKHQTAHPEYKVHCCRAHELQRSRSWEMEADKTRCQKTRWENANSGRCGGRGGAHNVVRLKAARRQRGTNVEVAFQDIAAAAPEAGAEEGTPPPCREDSQRPERRGY